MNISPIPALSDNYIWLLTSDGPECAIVDPGDHRPVIRQLKAAGLELKYILLTHHHADHIGGVPGLLRQWPATVIGPSDPRIPFNTRTVAEGDHVSLPELGLEFEVIEIPAHTSTHIAFAGSGLLFCGDTLFSIGCGRLFEGSPQNMQDSLDKLAGLPPETLVYCAHEYTQSNCSFALEVEPENKALIKRAKAVIKARENGEVTIPSTLAEELAANPFLRTREESVVNAARRLKPETSPGAETMAVIRAWKDRF
ncbi:MAG: hydroxyacylglutathione hydrolase [Lysobacterales bacterium]|jgi:hydroxyacylglutathione hydrolase